MDKIILSGCAIIEDEKLLLLYKDIDDYWEFPGGKVEEDESISEAALRETMEEIGCKVKILKHLVAIEFEKNGKTYVSHKFLANIESGMPYADGIEHSDILWLPIKDYKNYKLAPNAIIFCEKYLNKELNV
ncbi:MAG TPA: NUDIX domain-containing protein [bacterium]|jgi:8-oxo-dGTP diphosphatase|nr:NUDIX domain-containing protein [bacterium]HOG38393.1 NUDIX domain-containing protein [bacterium]HQI03351.1 NUDIX domain-containing protein [bacterium]